MKLSTIHILGVSGISAAAGIIGYLLGRKHGYELAEKDIFEEEYEEQKEEPVEENPIWTKSQFDIFWENRSPQEKLEWQMDYIPKLYDKYKDNVKPYIPEDEHFNALKEDEGLTWWQEYVLDDYHKKLKDYFANEEDEDIENLRTQGEVEYTSEEPYLVKEEDVFSLEADVNDIIQLTYYETDDVLVDSLGEILEERSVVVCEEFKKNFGYGSNDPNVVYVRNPKTKRDYEIVRDPGAYEQEVLGASDEQAINAVKYFKLGDAYERS